GRSGRKATDMRRESFAIIGAGRVGRTLGRILALRGFEPRGISCRRLPSARRAAAFIGGGIPTTRNLEAADAALVILSLPDSLVAGVARELAGARIRWKGRTVAHTSGALSSAALVPLARLGAEGASLHPLITLADAP